MSHELRTPLNSVIGSANILLKNKAQNLRSEDLTFVDRINANGKHPLRLINQILEECGSRFITADSGPQALLWAREVRPALILLDLMMPKMGGWQMLRHSAQAIMAKAGDLTLELHRLMSNALTVPAAGTKDGASRARRSSLIQWPWPGSAAGRR